MPMTTEFFEEKIPRSFVFSPLPEVPPAGREAVIVIADIPQIKPVLLPDAELQRVAKLTHAASRDRFLAGRYLVRGILSAWLDMDSEKIPIEITASGKPFFNHHEFGISHTQQLVAAVFSPMQAGIDLEKERPLDFHALANRFFSGEEVSSLARSQNLSDFFRFWCCRESAIKADGRGLGKLLDVTAVSPPSGAAERASITLVTIEGVVWHAYPWVLRAGIHGAVAFRDIPSVIHWCDLREPLG
ncbi:MAG: 4'-phosphopantetheinyl transferase superfamily protein [bacterium]